MRRSPRSGLVVAVTDGRGRAVTGGRALATWLANVAPSRVRGEVTIALVSDQHMRRLNRTYRGADYATDVLSFPDAAGGGVRGDLAIATGVARRQARQHGHRLRTELRLLALHGLLHLLGYDHDRDRGEMARVEERLRRRNGLPPGLVRRARGTARR